MRKGLLFFAAVFTTVFTFASLTVQAQSDSCCANPDSLKVTLITDSSFCVKWKIRDSSICDTAKAGVLQWRIIGAAHWDTAIIYYTPGQVYATFCHTATTCKKYQWRVESACRNNGDTTFSQWVFGSPFTIHCDSTPNHAFTQIGNVKNAALLIQATPNPAHDIITISGEYKGSGTITISIFNNKGLVVFTKAVVLQTGKFNCTVNTSAFEKGLYFVHGTDGKTSTRLVIMKE